jgi:glutamate transport system permease protein
MSSYVDTMFDPPGPRACRQIRVATGVSLLVAVGLVAIVIMRFAEAGGLAVPKWQIFGTPGALRLLWNALGATLSVSLVAGVIAFGLAVLLALLRMVEARGVRVIVTGYVEITRSLPTLLVLYFTILFLPHYGITMPVFWQLVAALVVTNAALISEILRASLLSIPRGQTEAAMSLGVTRARALRLIVLPQALRAATPALISQLVYLLKASTLGYVVSYAELLYSARVIGEYTGNLLQSFLVVTLIFLVINLALSRLALAIQARFSKRGEAIVDVEKERVSE